MVKPKQPKKGNILIYVSNYIMSLYINQPSFLFIIRDQKGSPMQEPLSIFLKIGKHSTFVIPKHF